MSDKCRILYKSSTSGAKSHSRPGRSTLVLGVGCMTDECQISVNMYWIRVTYVANPRTSLLLRQQICATTCGNIYHCKVLMFDIYSENKSR